MVLLFHFHVEMKLQMTPAKYGSRNQYCSRQATVIQTTAESQDPAPLPTSTSQETPIISAQLSKVTSTVSLVNTSNRVATACKIGNRLLQTLEL